MPITVVQKANSHSSASSGVAQAFPSNVTANNLLVVGATPIINASSALTFASISDTQSNTWKSGSMATRGNDLNGTAMVGIWYATAGSSAADTVTITCSSVQTLTNFWIYLLELSSVDTTPANIGSGSNSTNSDVTNIGTAASVSFGANALSFTVLGNYLGTGVTLPTNHSGFASDGTSAWGAYSLTDASPDSFTWSGLGNGAPSMAAITFVPTVATKFFESGPKRQYRREGRAR